MNKKIQIGQTVYLEPGINKSRYNKDIIETTVTKVGNKYFQLENNSRKKYEIDTLKEVSEYCADYYVYLTRQEIEDKNEREKLTSYLRQMFGAYGRVDLTLDQLRRIKKITEENNNV